MKILVTGAAGFIGFFVAKSLLDNGHSVVGLDNINEYYDINLKYDRLNELGVSKSDAKKFNVLARSSSKPNFSFIRMALEDRINLPILFEEHAFDNVCNLAAQAGVRYSLENPEVYVDSNIVGFLNILECCRNYAIKHLVYSSSSSVYGLNDKVPFKTSDRVDQPISLYAATKKSNELMAYTYSHLYNMATTGLRFFTVYGPWGRPDMAYFSFTKAIDEGRPIKVFNHGDMKRDFTWIDDIVSGVVGALDAVPGEGDKYCIGGTAYRIFNLGNHRSEGLLDFIRTIEQAIGRETEKEMLPMQSGDVYETYADIDAAREVLG